MSTTLKELAQFILDADNGIELEYFGAKTWHKKSKESDWSTYIKYRRKPQPSGSDIVRELLKKGMPVLCGVSSSSQDYADKMASDGHGHMTSSGMPDSVFEFRIKSGGTYQFASPVDTSKIAKWPEVEK